MSDHITRYSVMPIPANEAHTTSFRVGAIRVGVEYRQLTESLQRLVEEVLPQFE